jgi:iron complex transport system substrate-binding protein
MNAPRIASFLPAATEMVCLLGLEDQLVCVTHECDYPAQVRKKPVVIQCALELNNKSTLEIDQAVSEQLRSGKSLYHIDEAILQKTAPEIILTQDLCQVCAPSGNEVTQVLQKLSSKPEIIYQTPKNFTEVLESLMTLGRKTGKEREAEDWIQVAMQRVDRIVKTTENLPKVPCFFMEWVDPIYCGGHWISQMIKWAGGHDDSSRDGSDSCRIPWETVVQQKPEVLIVSPCGFASEKAGEQAELLKSRTGWAQIPAVQKGQVYAVDANSYFSRPGPRLVDGVELLAHLFHPTSIPWTGPRDAFRKIG